MVLLIKSRNLGYVDKHLTMDLYLSPACKVTNALKYFKMYFYNVLATMGYFFTFIYLRCTYCTIHIWKSEDIFPESVFPFPNLTPEIKLRRGQVAFNHGANVLLCYRNFFLLL